MSISSSILAATEKSIQKLFSDSNLTHEVTLKQFQGHSFDSELGMNVDVFINLTLTAIYTEKSIVSVPVPGASLVVGKECCFLFKCEDLAGPPDKRDFITDGNSAYAIEKIETILNLAYRIIVKGSET